MQNEPKSSGSAVREVSCGQPGRFVIMNLRTYLVQFHSVYYLLKPSLLFIWLSILFYVIVAWIFHTMEKIGRTGENPFEGSANDVPISTMARGIENRFKAKFRRIFR